MCLPIRLKCSNAGIFRYGRMWRIRHRMRGNCALAIPPAYEPTHCTKCGKVIKLGKGATPEDAKGILA